MRRRTFILGGGSIATAALAGCVGRAAPDDGEDADERTTAVSASGEARAAPDMAHLRVSVEEEGEETDTVRDTLVEKEASLRAALIDAGVEEDDITTSRFDIRERRPPREVIEEEEERDDEPTVEGVHTLAVEVDDVDGVGEIIDAAIDGGADRVGGVRFSLSDQAREELREEALAEAIEEAEAEAAYIAGEVGTEVAQVEHIDASDGGRPELRYELDMAEDGDTATEIHPDDIEVTASVDAVFVIE